MAKARDPVPPEVVAGLCARCVHAVRQEGARGSGFWRCLRADDDPRFRRYPPLPVVRCPGHETAGPGGGERGRDASPC